MRPGLARLGKCQDRNRIMLNPSPLLQAIDPLHNIFCLHSSSFMPFRTVKSSTCKTQAQAIGLPLINSPGLSVSVSLPAITQLSSPNNKNNAPSLFVHNLRGWGIDLIITACSKTVLQNGTQARINETDYSQEESDRSSEEQPQAHKNRISKHPMTSERQSLFWCSRAEKRQQLRQRFENKSWTLKSTPEETQTWLIWCVDWYREATAMRGHVTSRYCWLSHCRHQGFLQVQRQRAFESYRRTVRADKADLKNYAECELCWEWKICVHTSMRVSVCICVSAWMGPVRNTQYSRMQTETFPWPWVSPNTFHWLPHTALGCLNLASKFSHNSHGRHPSNKDGFSVWF